MKKFFLLIALLFSISVTYAQVQQGFVKTKGRMVNGKHVRGKGLKGATVFIKGQTSMLVKSEDGSFSFPVSKERMYCVDSVKKKDYELVDYSLLRSHLFSGDTLFITMETPSQKTQDLLDSEKKIRRTLQKQLQQREEELETLREAHKITLEEYQVALQKLYQDQESNESLIKEMAKRYSEMDYDQMNDVNRRVSEAILDGRLTEADSLLHLKGSMKARITEANRKRQSADLRKQEIAQEQYELEVANEGLKKEFDDIALDCYREFEIYKMQYQNDSAAFYIELRAGLEDGLNLSYLCDAANFFYSQKDFKKAESYYNEIRTLVTMIIVNYQISQADPSSFTLQIFEPVIIPTWCNLASIYDETDHFKESEKLYLEVLEWSRQMEQGDPGYKKYVMKITNNLGILYFNTRQYEKCENMYLESVEISRELAESNPQVYLFKYCLNSALTNLGELYCELGKYEESETVLNESVEIARDHIKDLPDLFEPKLAGAIGGLGTLYKETRRYSESEECYNEALEIMSQLEGKNPDAYEPSICKILVNLGNLYLVSNRYDESIAAYSAAVEKYKHLISKNTQTREYLFEDVLYKNLVSENSQAYAEGLAQSLHVLAFVYSATNRFSESEAMYNEAIEIYRLLVKNNVEYELLLAETLFNYGQLKVREEHLDESFAPLYEALELYKKMVVKDPSQQQRCLMLYNFMSLYSLMARQYDVMNRYLSEAKSLDSSQPWIYSLTAAGLLSQGYYAEAEQIYLQYKDMYKEKLLYDLNKLTNIIPEEHSKELEHVKQLLLE